MRAITNGKRLPLLTPECCKVVPYTEQGYSEEYHMYVEVGTMFRCNSAQYDHAYRHAKQMLARELYKDVYGAIDRLRCLAFDCDDCSELMEELERLEECINE